MSEMPDEPASEEAARKGRGEFFSVDRRTWALLCDFGDVKQAVTYLAIAQGTLKGGRLSNWSAKSIETHLGLHSTRAKKVIGEVIDLGFLKRDVTAHSTSRRPRYVVLPFHEVFEETLNKRIAKFSFNERWVMERVIEAGDSGWASTSRSRKSEDSKALTRLRHAGLLRQEHNQWHVAKPNTTPELIWLPNAIVQGTDRGEASPLRELRRENDIWALRLLIDLYQAQNLSADGGISRKVFRADFTAKILSPRGRHVIIGFSWGQGWATSVEGITDTHWCRPKNQEGQEEEESPIWQSMNILREKGLVVVVPHLVENADPECEIIHAYGINDDAELMERELGEAAQEAAEYLLGEEWTYNHTSRGSAEHLAPTYATNKNMQMVGIYRLRYRPRTSLTADWYRRLKQDHAEWCATYARICGKTSKIAEAANERAG